MQTIEVAELLGVARSTVTRWLRLGQLAAYKSSPSRTGLWYIYTDSLIEFMRKSGRRIPPELLETEPGRTGNDH